MLTSKTEATTTSGMQRYRLDIGRNQTQGVLASPYLLFAWYQTDDYVQARQTTRRASKRSLKMDHDIILTPGRGSRHQSLCRTFDLEEGAIGLSMHHIAAAKESDPPGSSTQSGLNMVPRGWLLDQGAMRSDRSDTSSKIYSRSDRRHKYNHSLSRLYDMALTRNPTGKLTLRYTLSLPLSQLLVELKLAALSAANCQGAGGQRNRCVPVERLGTRPPYSQGGVAPSASFPSFFVHVMQQRRRNRSGNTG